MKLIESLPSPGSGPNRDTGDYMSDLIHHGFTVVENIAKQRLFVFHQSRFMPWLESSVSVESQDCDIDHSVLYFDPDNYDNPLRQTIEHFLKGEFDSIDHLLMEEAL